MFAVVAFSANDEGRIVTCVFERRRYILIGDIPASGVEIQVVLAVLQKNTQRFGLGFANQRRVNLAAAQIRETADEAQHAMKGVGPVPCRRERSDTAGARAGDGAVVRIARKLVQLGHFRQNLFDQKPRVAVAQPVVFETAVVAALLLG